MTFIRPELSEAIVRFRDAIAGVAVSLVGLYWALGSVGTLSVLGTSMVVAGALLVFAGIQRGRFRTGAGGAGVVLVDEGQVTYFGPVEGGTVVISEIDRVAYEPGINSNSEWILDDKNENPLRIPTNAEGAEALFDVFAGLEGLHTEKMLSVLENSHPRQVVIWESNATSLH